MVRITKVYTRTGDAGMTRLAGGQAVKKTSLRIAAYGSVDELNAHLGLAAESLRNGEARSAKLRERIVRIQQQLFNLGAQLAVLPEDRRPDTPVIRQGNVTALEAEMDEMNGTLEPLTSFILPGGGETAARLHVARTVCRRAERDIIRLGEAEALDGTEIPFINRLSDWLFVAARYAAHLEQIPETLWRPEAGE